MSKSRPGASLSGLCPAWHLCRAWRTAQDRSLISDKVVLEPSLYTCNSSCLFGHSHSNSWEFILLSHSHPVWAFYCIYIHTLNTEAAIKVTSDRGGFQPTRKIQTGNQVSHLFSNKIRWAKPLKDGSIRALSIKKKKPQTTKKAAPTHKNLAAEWIYVQDIRLGQKRKKFTNSCTRHICSRLSP